MFETFVIENDLIVSMVMTNENGVSAGFVTVKYDENTNIPPLPTLDGNNEEIVWTEM